MKLELEQISLSYGSGQRALRDVDLQVAPGERIVLLGASGSGKTSLLKVVAGLETPTQGRLKIDGRDCSTIPPHARGIAMAFQTPALLPHKTVAANLAQGGVPSKDRQERIRSLAERLEIAELLERYPETLSGGQRARVGLGRALASGRSIVLLDEPFSGLDSPLRVTLRDLLLDLQAEQGFTFLFVTHDQDDAATIADRVVVLENGRILQSGTPESVYADPQSWTAAVLTSRKPWNRVEAQIASQGERIQAVVGGRPGVSLGQSHWHPSWVGKTVVGAIHPDDMRLADPSEANAQCVQIRGRFARFEGAGIDRICVIKSDEQSFRGRCPRDAADPDRGAGLMLEGDAERMLWFSTSDGRRLSPTEQHPESE